MAHCPVCGSSAQIDDSNPHELKITCTGCAKFVLTDVALNTIPKDRYPNWQQTLQEFIRMNQTASFVEITDPVIKSIFGY
jgi:hypothetical protein